MNQFLVLRIANPYSWVITGADGGRVGPVATGELADAAPTAKDRPVVVVAPGSSVTLARPGTARQGGRAAGAGRALRDGGIARGRSRELPLRDRRDRCGRQHAGRGVAPRRNARWLAALTAAGIEPQAIVPDTLCLPDNPGKIVAVIDSGLLLVRVPGSLPVALDAEPLTESFTLAGTRGRRPPRAALRVAARLAAFARDDRGAAGSDGQPRPADPARWRAAAACSPRPCAPKRFR